VKQDRVTIFVRDCEDFDVMQLMALLRAYELKREIVFFFFFLFLLFHFYFCSQIKQRAGKGGS
jgi:hypothetical protein